jgi:hypothetical protein
MSKTAQNSASPEHTRAATVGVILCLLGGFIALSMGTTSTRERNEQRTAAESAYIEANGCVVAQMDGRFVAKYRCEKPETRYLSSAQLAHDAMAGAPKP